MRHRPIQSRILPAALLALGVVMTLGSLGDAALAMAVCSREAVLTRSEHDAVAQFLASLGGVTTKPAQQNVAMLATHATPTPVAPRSIAATQPENLDPPLTGHLPHLLSLPPPCA